MSSPHSHSPLTSHLSPSPLTPTLTSQADHARELLAWHASAAALSKRFALWSKKRAAEARAQEAEEAPAEEAAAEGAAAEGAAVGEEGEAEANASRERQKRERREREMRERKRRMRKRMAADQEAEEAEEAEELWRRPAASRRSRRARRPCACRSASSRVGPFRVTGAARRRAARRSPPSW